jgi:hypothetical protein
MPDQPVSQTVTHQNVIDDLKQCVQLIEDLDKMQVATLDFYDISLAKNMLNIVIKNNGVKVENQLF